MRHAIGFAIAATLALGTPAAIHVTALRADSSLSLAREPVVSFGGRARHALPTSD
jgi:hypothetical protein